MSRKFIMGVELLAGLAIGAAAAAAAVSFIIAFLVVRDLESETDRMAVSVAYTLSVAAGEEFSPEEVVSIIDPLIAGGNYKAAVVLDRDGMVTASSGITGENSLPERGDEDWVFAQSSETGLSVGLMPDRSMISGIGRILLTGLGAITAALVLLAFLTPKYLAERVIEPLRSILVEADRFTDGGGTTPEAAGASFHRLVELLHQRDRQLDTLRKNAEDRADRIEKRSSMILSALGSAVLALDEEDRLKLFNPQSKELFRLKDLDMGGKFPWKRSAAGRELKQIVRQAESEGTLSGEFQLREGPGRGGMMYSVEISRAPSGETAVLVTDVSRIGELERRIADQTAMADIGAASAGISHEMGNTLCALSGFVDLLTRGHSDDRTRRILSEVRREVTSAQNLISSFGNFARSPQPDEQSLQENDLMDICREVAKLHGSRIEVSMECGDERVTADDRLLASCLRNLVRNSLEASPDSKVEIDVYVEDDYLFIEVRDDGPGLSIDAEELFRPFRTTKDRSSGNMGLGLSVSRRIIRSMGGELRAENVEKGAVFVILLPVSEERKDG
ncbi:MAG: hypothetical protein GF388_09455 [Candidatus Aegiribacteria sp.]|nr:hypothetical protein [Candidatus Aegiribacteria sp.]MBD3295281.1 hypothetical protein [Candidatus Fermentibacteria bacterium]